MVIPQLSKLMLGVRFPLLAYAMAGRQAGHAGSTPVSRYLLLRRTGKEVARVQFPLPAVAMAGAGPPAAATHQLARLTWLHYILISISTPAGRRAGYEGLTPFTAFVR